MNQINKTYRYLLSDTRNAHDLCECLPATAAEDGEERTLVFRWGATKRKFATIDGKEFCWSPIQGVWFRPLEASEETPAMHKMARDFRRLG